jgi:hypothetical protein
LLRKPALRLVGALILLGSATLPSVASSAADVAWLRQLGTSAAESAFGVAPDGAGGVYVGGWTSPAVSGGSDYANGFVRRYDAAGNTVWTRAFGTAANDYATAVARGGADGVYAVGWTDGTFPGQAPAGERDAFVRRFDGAGNELWTRQFGTAQLDLAQGAAVDRAGNLVVVGWTDGTFPGQAPAGGRDGFVRKYDSNGNELWTRQVGGAFSDYAYAVAADDAGNIYVGGSTDGGLTEPSGGRTDAFVRKYDANGSVAWTHQFGTATYDAVFGLAADRFGNVYAAGFTDGALRGQLAAA